MTRRYAIGLTVVLAALVGCEHARRDTPSAGGRDVPSAGPPRAASPDGGTVIRTSGITDVAFIDDPAGPRILVGGTDPDERLESVWIDLLDEAGLPASIDPDGDGSSEAHDLEVPLTVRDRDGDRFLLEVQGSPGLERFVRRVVATPQDLRGRRGLPMTASLSPLAVREAGEACDPRGFDTCTVAHACVVRGGAARCEDRDHAREERCAAAPVISGSGRVTGELAATSLWDPIDGCASSARRGRPEAVVRVRVPAGASSLTIQTTERGTTFDSVVSLLDGCGSAATVLACNDDDPAPVSRISLGDVLPGDYVVVVDSLDRGGGAFELEVTAR